MKLKKEDFKILSQETAFKGQIFDVVKSRISLPNGKIANWESIKGPEIVVGVVLTDKNTVILKKEFRAAHGEITLETPAGKADAKTEKERVKELNRELQEEIGIKGNKIEKLYSGFLEAHNSKMLHIYLVRGLEKSELPPDNDEIIETFEMPFDKALKLVLSGKQDTTFATVIGLLLAKEKLGL